MADARHFTRDGVLFRIAGGEVTRLIRDVAAGSDTTDSLNDLADVLLSHFKPSSKFAPGIHVDDRPTTRQDVIDALAQL